MRHPGSMDQAVWAVLEEYEARAQREKKIWSTLSAEESMRRRDEMLLPVGRAAGTLMNLLVKEGEARRILEVGSSYGYSTTRLAEGGRRHGRLARAAGRQDRVCARATGARRARAVRRVSRRRCARIARAARGTIRFRADRPVEDSVRAGVRAAASEAGTGCDHRRQQHAAA